MQEKIKNILQELKNNSNYRNLTSMKHQQEKIIISNQTLINLASNDYLGIAQDRDFINSFYQQVDLTQTPLSSSSSRSLSGNFEIFEEFEKYLDMLYFPKQALIFNSGYHANLGIIDALAQIPNTLFLADSFVHASIFDGLRISRAKFKRFAHNNMQELESLLKEYHNSYEHIIILSEGLFSMDGDFCNINKLIKFKKIYKNVLIYIDEAHSIGTYGQELLGLCKDLKALDSIDFLILAFGKAIGSCGGCVLCDDIFRQYFINKARTLIYSTAIAPISIAFCLFVFKNLPHLTDRQNKLHNLSKFLKKELLNRKMDFIGDSHIISLMTYENKKALDLSDKLFKYGFFAPAIKYPSVPENQARIRISLNANLNEGILQNLLEVLCK